MNRSDFIVRPVDLLYELGDEICQGGKLACLGGNNEED